MSSIKKYEEIIKAIPVKKHSVIVRKENWIKNDSLHTRLTRNNNFPNNNEDLLNILQTIFKDAKNGQIEISRADILTEDDLEKKLIKILLWGYPTGGRKNNIDEFKNVIWKRTNEKFFEYLEIANNISNGILNDSEIKPESIELFLFLYNMHFNLQD